MEKQKKEKETKKVLTKEIKEKMELLDELNEAIPKSMKAIVDEANNVTMGIERSLIKLNDLCADYRKQKAQFEALELEVAPFEDDAEELEDFE